LPRGNINLVSQLSNISTFRMNGVQCECNTYCLCCPITVKLVVSTVRTMCEPGAKAVRGASATFGSYSWSAGFSTVQSVSRQLKVFPRHLDYSGQMLNQQSGPLSGTPKAVRLGFIRRGKPLKDLWLVQPEVVSLGIVSSALWRGEKLLK
jgi:hypothetical protein